MINIKKLITIVISTSKLALGFTPKYFILLKLASIALALGFVWQSETQTKFFNSALEVSTAKGGKQVFIGFSIFILSYMITQILAHVSNGIEEILQFRLEKQISKRLSEKACKISPIYYEDVKYLELLSKAKEGTSALVSITLCALALIFYYVPYFIFMGYWLFQQNSFLIFIIPIVFLPAVCTYLGQMKVFVEHTDSLASDKRRLNSYEDSMIGKGFIKETRILGCFPYFMNLYRETLDIISRKEYDLRSRRQKLNLSLKLIHVIGFILILVISLLFVIKGEISVGVFAAILSSVDLMFSNMDEAISRQFGTITEEFGTVNYYYEFMNENKYTEKQDGHDLTHSISELNHVTFIYPNALNKTLDNISLKIMKGQRIAIVGENGAGKTTLSKLLLGLYQPTTGQVVADIPLSKGKSVVFQNYCKYSLSLESNITISSEEGSNSKDLEYAIKESGTMPIIKKLEYGKKTLLGKDFGGVELSGGEWQRVAIGRGIYKSSDFMVFDEPTSAIDPIEESKLYEKIEAITKGKTAIIVTHRMASIKFVDRILVMSKGKIIEDGSHQELMNLNGEYAKIYRIQSKFYT